VKKIASKCDIKNNYDEWLAIFGYFAWAVIVIFAE
jgi:hypothetical protein